VNHFSPKKSSNNFFLDLKDSVRLISCPLVEIIPAKPKTHLQSKRPPAIIQYTEPLIVPDPPQLKLSVTIDELDKNQIGPEAREGETGVNEVQSASESSGQGNILATPSEPESEKILDIAEFMPEFPGGIEALHRFLSKNLRMPREDLDPGSTVRVLVKFVVDKDGSISGIELMQSGGNDFDDEVKRVMKKMPHWKPGKQNGRSIAVYYTLPVIFQAPADN
jgi:protein TonB